MYVQLHNRASAMMMTAYGESVRWTIHTYCASVKHHIQSDVISLRRITEGNCLCSEISHDLKHIEMGMAMIQLIA